MGFVKDLFKTVIDTGKSSIDWEIKERTRKTVKNVSKKVSDTVSNIGDKVEDTVKSGIENLTKGDDTQQNGQIVETQVDANMTVDMPNGQYSQQTTNMQSNNFENGGFNQVTNDASRTYNQELNSIGNINNSNQMNYNQQTIGNTSNNTNMQSTSVTTEFKHDGISSLDLEKGKANIENMTQGINTIFQGSIAEDVANILEKKNIMSREELSQSANNLEKALTTEVNKATDMINEMYNKNTTGNDNVSNLGDAFNHLKDASSNIGSNTDNKVGQIFNESVKNTLGDDVSFEQVTSAFDAPSQALVDNIQEKMDEYKSVDK